MMVIQGNPLDYITRQKGYVETTRFSSINPDAAPASPSSSMLTCETAHSDASVLIFVPNLALTSLTPFAMAAAGTKNSKWRVPTHVF